MKSLNNHIQNFIVKRIKKPRKYNYYFYRWLVDAFYKQNDLVLLHTVFPWMRANNLEMLQYTDIFVIGKTIFIYTVRPGLWIGRHGQTIDSLKKLIKESETGHPEYADYKVELIEDNQTAHATPLRYYSYY